MNSLNIKYQARLKMTFPAIYHPLTQTKSSRVIYMKSIFFAALFFICFATNAEWVSVMHKDHKVEYMVDTSKVIIYSSSILVPTLLNFKDAQIGADGQPYLSELVSVEYDCAQKKTRQHFIKRYGENLAVGIVISNFDSKSDWKNFIENPYASILQNMICRR